VDVTMVDQGARRVATRAVGS